RAAALRHLLETFGELRDACGHTRLGVLRRTLRGGCGLLAALGGLVGPLLQLVNLFLLFGRRAASRAGQNSNRGHECIAHWEPRGNPRVLTTLPQAAAPWRGAAACRDTADSARPRPASPTRARALRWTAGPRSGTPSGRTQLRPSRGG